MGFVTATQVATPTPLGGALCAERAATAIGAHTSIPTTTCMLPTPGTPSEPQPQLRVLSYAGLSMPPRERDGQSGPCYR